MDKNQAEEKIDTIEGLARLVKRGFDDVEDKFTRLDHTITGLRKDIVDIKSGINWIKKDVVQREDEDYKDIFRRIQQLEKAVGIDR